MPLSRKGGCKGSGFLPLAQNNYVFILGIFLWKSQQYSQDY